MSQVTVGRRGCNQLRRPGCDMPESREEVHVSRWSNRFCQVPLEASKQPPDATMLQMLQAQSDFVGSSNCRDAPALLFRYGMNCPGTTQGHPNSDKGPGLASFCSAKILLGLHHASAPPGCSTHRISGKTSSSITFSVK